MRTFAVIAFLSLSFVPIAFVSAVYAEPPTNTVTPLLNPLSGVDCRAGNGNCVFAFLFGILDIITKTIGPVVVILMMVYVGFKFVVAQGVPAKIAEAKQMLLWTVIGALILLGARVIAVGICETVQALSTNPGSCNFL